MKQLYLAIVVIVAMLCASPALAWDGYDYESGNYIEIEKGNLVRPGEEIEYYDYGSGEYKYGDVESIESYGSFVEVEIYDHESGEYRTFEMDK